jgi:hypothetical protein
MVEPSCSQLVQKAVDMALTGNEPMLRLLLDRILPARPKEEPININLESTNLVDKTRTIFKALSDGQISPSETTTLVHAISIEAKIYETEELKQRLVRLEQTTGLTNSD